ncbi:MAG: FecR domain-containing protein [Candidatus Omnitrophica bacterium]|nr:FecR domain-containing protein [Candidatus Omnitrophota bacterium]
MTNEASKFKWVITIGFFLLLWGIAAVPFLIYPPSPSLTYEIQNFSGAAHHYGTAEKSWVPPQRSEILKVGDRLRTGPRGETDFRIPGQMRLRLKENSEIELRAPRFFERSRSPRLLLRRGVLLGATENQALPVSAHIVTPAFVAKIREGIFQIETDPKSKVSVARVLRGSLEIFSFQSRQSVTVRSLERTEVSGKKAPQTPVRVDRQEWNKMKEAYELIFKDTTLEKRQFDLSKQAGSFFQYVIDHGTFYTPSLGYAEREFFKGEGAGETQMEVGYDVFPVGSLVGVYFKTRDLDLSTFKGLEFEIRGDPEEGVPDSFKIELKSGSGVVRAFKTRGVKEAWQTFQFPWRFTRSKELSEMTFVFSNEKAGNQKKGLVVFRRINLLTK